MSTKSQAPDALARFRSEYGCHRAAEGRLHSAAELHELPYLRHGPLARQWQVRARSYEALLERIVKPFAAETQRPLDVLDLGAGNGWLSHRLAQYGHRTVALDFRDDDVDGLGAGRVYLANGARPFVRVCASFDALPFAEPRFDLAIFNASLHYALDLAQVLTEVAGVVRRGGRLVVVDSPCYRRERDGEAMVAEKRRDAAHAFGGRADALLALPFVEFLTRSRLHAAARGVASPWQRHRVRYPLWYEARPLAARLQRRRAPSRFDIWECRVA